MSLLSHEFCPAILSGNKPLGMYIALSCNILFLDIMSKIQFKERKCSFLISPPKISYTAPVRICYLTEVVLYGDTTI